jgi:hypothetical protein
MRFSPIRKFHFFTAIAFLISTFFIVSCKKQLTLESKTEKFFQLDKQLTPQIKEIYNKLKAQNDKKPFVDKLPENSGHPLWDKIIFANTHNPEARSLEQDSVEIIIPMASETGEYLSSVLNLKPNENGYLILDFTKEYLYEICHKLFQTQEDISKAENVLGLFLLLDKYIYGTEIFKNIPLELFVNSTQINVNIQNDSKDLNILTYDLTTVSFTYSAHVATIDWNWVIWLAQGWDPSLPDDGSEIIILDSGNSGGGGTEAGSPPCTNSWYKTDSSPCIPITDNYYTIANETFVAPPQEQPINILEYLQCFTSEAGSTYMITVGVDQPEPGSRTPYTIGNDGSSSSSGGDIDVGHTFITLVQTKANGTKIIRTLGYYPTSSVKPLSPSSQGTLANDQGHHFDVSLTTDVTVTNFLSLIQILQANATEPYNLNSNNCTTFCIHHLQEIGINLPANVGVWPMGGGFNPGSLGEDIRSMDLAPNQSRNTNGGEAPINSGTC